jgi:hypothetical protein
LGLIISQKGSPGGMLLNIQLGNARETIILIFPSKCVGPLQGQTWAKRYLTHARLNEIEGCMKHDSLNAHSATKKGMQY